MKNTIRAIILETLRGDTVAFQGLIDSLFEQGLTLQEIAELAEKHFDIPKYKTIETIQTYV